MIRMVLLATERYPKASRWYDDNSPPPGLPAERPVPECGWAYKMASFPAADRTIRELCPGIYFVSSPSLDSIGIAAKTRVHSYFDKEGLAGLVIETPDP